MLQESFDPSIPSQTCKAAPKQIKIFDNSYTEVDSNPDKKIFQDFKAKLLPSLSKEVKISDLRVSVSGREDPQNPTVYPKIIKLKEDKDVPFGIVYNCK